MNREKKSKREKNNISKLTELASGSWTIYYIDYLINNNIQLVVVIPNCFDSKMLN